MNSDFDDVSLPRFSRQIGCLHQHGDQMDSTIGLLSPFTGLLDVRLTRAGGITTDLSYLALGGLVDQALTDAVSQRGRIGLDGSTDTHGSSGAVGTAAGRDTGGVPPGGSFDGELTVGAVLRAAPAPAGAAGRPSMASGRSRTDSGSSTGGSRTDSGSSSGGPRPDSGSSSGRSTGGTDGISLDQLDARSSDDASEPDSSGESPGRDASSGSTGDHPARRSSVNSPAVPGEGGSATFGETAPSDDASGRRTVFEPMTVLDLDLPGGVEDGPSPARTNSEGRPFPEVTATSSGGLSHDSVVGPLDVTVLDSLGNRAIGSDGQPPSAGTPSSDSQMVRSHTAGANVLQSDSSGGVGGSRLSSSSGVDGLRSSSAGGMDVLRSGSPAEADGSAMHRADESTQMGSLPGDASMSGGMDRSGLTPVDARGAGDGFEGGSSGPLTGGDGRDSTTSADADTGTSMPSERATLTTVDHTAQSAGSSDAGTPTGSSARGSPAGSSTVGTPAGSATAAGTLGGTSAAGTLDGPSSVDAPTMTFRTDSGSSAPRPDSSRADGPSLTVRHERDATGPEGDNTSSAESETGPADSLDESEQSPAPPDPVQWLQENGEDSRRFIDQLYRELERKVAIERDRGGSLL